MKKIMYEVDIVLDGRIVWSRRVYIDESDKKFVKIAGEWKATEELVDMGYSLHYWRSVCPGAEIVNMKHFVEGGHR